MDYEYWGGSKEFNLQHFHNRISNIARGIPQRGSSNRKFTRRAFHFFLSDTKEFEV